MSLKVIRACLPPQISRGLSPPAQHPWPSCEHCQSTCVLPSTTFLTANTHVPGAARTPAKGNGTSQRRRSAETRSPEPSAVTSGHLPPHPASTDALRTEFNTNCFTKYGCKPRWPCLTTRHLHFRQEEGRYLTSLSLMSLCPLALLLELGWSWALTQQS